MPACPALFIAAPASGQGKTMATAALARYHTRQGRQVQVFKCGPDFLDPMIHQVASNYPCYNLDLGMCGEQDAAWRLAQAAETSDLILVEGVMGLFDGTPSGADLARRFKLPVLAVIDAHAMAQSFGALVHGLATYQPDLKFAGALANKVNSPQHAWMLQDSLPPNIHWYGNIPQDTQAQLPERYMGLFLPEEIQNLQVRLDKMADILGDMLGDTAAAHLPSPTSFAHVAPPAILPMLAGKTIAIARDRAYSFIYPANLKILEALGATLKFFSPLAHDPLPNCSAVWLPGGYPELYAPTLADCHPLWADLHQHVEQGKPLLAEGGGIAGLLETLADQNQETHTMGGLLPGHMIMTEKLAALGTQTARFPEGNFTGHTFHYSHHKTRSAPSLHAQYLNGGAGEAIYRKNRLIASYLHLYFPYNPEGIAQLLGS
ncbi:MAG: cobyrinate a,c-diamide synthase [Azovibrio sp.]